MNDARREQGMTAFLQPCDQQQGVNRLLKHRIYAALDNEFVSRICKQVGINFTHPQAAGDYELAEKSNHTNLIEENSER